MGGHHKVSSSAFLQKTFHTVGQSWVSKALQGKKKKSASYFSKTGWNKLVRNSNGMGRAGMIKTEAELFVQLLEDDIASLLQMHTYLWMEIKILQI